MAVNCVLKNMYTATLCILKLLFINRVVSRPTEISFYEQKMHIMCRMILMCQCVENVLFPLCLA